LKRRRHTKTTPHPVDPLLLISGALEERWARFSQELARCRRKPTEPAIHDLRVAMRRLLAAMNTVDQLLPGRYFRRSSNELRKHLKAFNNLRDVHVQLLALRGLRRRFPLVRQYEAFIRKQEIPVLRKVRSELRGIRQFPLIGSLANVQVTLTNLYGNPSGRRALHAILVGSAASAFGRVLARSRAISVRDARSIHRMRVAFKKFRYTVELNGPLLPWADKKHGRAMDAFQTAMGEIQDLEVLAAGLRRFAQRSAPSATLLFLPLFQFLASIRTARLNTFLRAAEHLEDFWQ